MKFLFKIFIFSLVIFTFVFFNSFSIFAQTTSSNSGSPSDIGDCASQNLTVQQCVDYYQGKVNQANGEISTLTGQIQVMDNQINLTEARIEATKVQINEITLNIDTTSKKITNLQSSVDNLTKLLLGKIVATYEVGSIQPMQILLTSSTASDFFQRASYLRVAQEHDKKLLYDTVSAKNDYQNEQSILETQRQQVESLQTQLQSYTEQLSQEKGQKQTLLTQTQGQEATYQSLLSQAKAQLAGFSNFVSAQGGASILSNQTVCDGWGCYYNQRDSQWGNVSLNNSGYSIADDGCLLTSMAMVYTHYGHRSVTPLTINSNSNNFASYYPAYLLKTITADGATSSRISADIDSVLSSGNPVIVGISYDGGPIADHFVVLTSGSGGSYQMNDPFVPNGHEINFTDHYSVGSIVEIDRVQF